MAKTTDEKQDIDYHFSLGLRDENAPNHWREAPKNYSFAGHKTILIFPGSATHSSQAANGMCKVVESMLSEKERKNADICSIYYPEKTIFREGSVVRAMTLLDEYIIPLVSKKDKDGYLEKIPADKAARNLRNLIIVTHCYGSYMVEAIDIQLEKDLKTLGYSEKEQNNIQKQLFVVHHNDISDLLSRREMKSTNLYRITQADERRELSKFNSDGFQYYAQSEQINKDEALYVKVGRNERALLIKQVTENGVNEHNNGYWNDEKKSEGGEKEKQIFELIFSEAVRSSYPLDNIEKLLHNIGQQQPEMKNFLEEPLRYGKEFSDEYAEYHRDFVQKNAVLRQKQKENNLKEKEVKALPPEVLLYRDENEMMLLDYAIEENNVQQAKILWTAVRKVLPKREGLYELEYEKLSRNYKDAYENNKIYLQMLLGAGRGEMFGVLAKGVDCLPRLDYSAADDETLLDAAKVYAGLPANTGQLDRLYYYKSLVYMYARIEQMPQTEKTTEILKQLDSKIFTKSNAKDRAVKYKINSYASKFGAHELARKCVQNWQEKPLLNQNSEELNK